MLLTIVYNKSALLCILINIRMLYTVVVLCVKLSTYFKGSTWCLLHVFSKGPKKISLIYNIHFTDGIYYSYVHSFSHKLVIHGHVYFSRWQISGYQSHPVWYRSHETVQWPLLHILVWYGTPWLLL